MRPRRKASDGARESAVGDLRFRTRGSRSSAQTLRLGDRLRPALEGKPRDRLRPPRQHLRRRGAPRPRDRGLRPRDQTEAGSAPLYNDRGIAYDDEGDYDRAIADFSKAIALRPDYAEAYNNRGTAYHRKANEAQAISDFSRAIQLKPTYARAYYNRAVTRHITGDKDGAKSDYYEAVKLNPSLKFTIPDGPRPRIDALVVLQRLDAAQRAASRRRRGRALRDRDPRRGP